MNLAKIILIVIIFTVTNVYALLVGKYQFFPYKLISDLKQSINGQLESDYFYKLENNSPKLVADRLTFAAQDLARINQFAAVPDVTGDIERLVLKANPVAPQRVVSLPVPSAYVTRRSVQAGKALEVHVHAPNGATAEVFWLGGQKVLVKNLPSLGPVTQSANYSEDRGLSWRPTLLVPTDGLKSGYYLLELRDLKTGAMNQMPFVISPVNHKRVAFVAATYTWAAFNSFAGKNFYTDVHVPKEIAEKRAALNGIMVTLGKPVLPITLPVARVDQFESPILDTKPNVPHYSHLLRAAWNLTAFAEEHGIDYGVFTDEDLNRMLDIKGDSALWNAEIIVLGPHTEYWTPGMLKGLSKYLDKGGKVIFAGGNSAFFEVHANSINIKRIQHIAPDVTTKIAGAYTGDLSNPMFAPLKVVAPDHWIFAGTSVREGSLFGHESLNHREEAKAKGVSGWEADQLSSGSLGFVLLAKGENIRGPAEMVFKDTPTGGWVFNASTIPFAGALAVDPVISRMMLNLLSGGPVRK